jgi:spermidine synthase
LCCGELDSAIAHCQKALEIKPDFAEAHCNLGGALFGRGEVDSAIAHYQKALRIRPDLVQARHNLDVILAERERIRKNLAQQREALRLQPKDTALLNNIAWMLATNPNASVRNGADAVELTERALKLSGGNQPAILDTLAAAYAEVGRFSEAVATARKALDLATQQNKRPLADALRTRIALYGTGKPYRQTPSRSAPAPTNPNP